MKRVIMVLVFISIISLCFACSGNTSDSNNQEVKNEVERNNEVGRSDSDNLEEKKEVTTIKNTEDSTKPKTDNLSVDERAELVELVNNLKKVIARTEEGYYAKEVEEVEEDPQSYIDNGWCKNPRGVEWLYFADDVEKYLYGHSQDNIKSILTKEMLRVFKSSYYSDKDGSEHQRISGEENINITIYWLNQKINEIEKLLAQ